MSDKTYTTVTQADQVTEEILQMVREIESGWYAEGTIDWEDVWDRLDGSRLNDDTCIDLGNMQNTPAMRKIKRIIRAERAVG